MDPEGLAKKGLNYDPNWRGRPEGWKPTGNKPPNILPKNYKPNGINNLPGQKIPMSPNAGKGSKGASCAIRALNALEKLLDIISGGVGATLIIYVPTENGIIAPPPNNRPYDPVYNPYGTI